MMTGPQSGRPGSQAGVACGLGESEEAGDVGEQRHREGQWEILADRWRE